MSLEMGYHLDLSKRCLMPLGQSDLGILPDSVNFDGEKLKLTHDIIGKKQIYYQLEDHHLYFASCLKPLMKRPGFKKSIRKDVLSRYLYHQYICHPESIFEGVYKLPPGSVLKLDLSGQVPFCVEIQKYWDIAEIYHEKQKAPVTDFGEAKIKLRELLEKAVRSQFFANQPPGAFLSGGYDSSLVCAIAAEMSLKPLKTFTIGFCEKTHNEAEYAKKVAEYLGTDHTEAYVTEDEMFAMLESLPEYYDEPFADQSQIPTMLVAKLASNDIRVALTGDGGDEFFCGYHIYEKLRLAQKMDIPGGMVHALLNLPGIRHFDLESRLPFRARVISANRAPEAKVQFGRGSYVDIVEKMVDCESPLLVTYPIESRYQVDNWQIRRMLLDMETYLPAVLRKVERAMARYSLESMSPFLTQEVTEYSFQLNHSFKYQNGVTKRILKELTYDYLPRVLLDRPKAGFTVPLDKWLRGPLREQLTDMVNIGYLHRQGLFHADNTVKMIQNYLISGDGGPSSGANHSRLVWSFFAFQKWYDYYIKK